MAAWKLETNRVNVFSVQRFLEILQSIAWLEG
jgi:hypothetical protein